MQRILQLVLTALFFAFLTKDNHVEGKICPSLDIRNDPSSFEKLRNCTVIMGKLYIVLMENVNDSPNVFDNYSFPELTEIVDYLLIFKINRLTSLGTLFPNLRVIRGRQRFLDYSLIIYRLPHLQEIGLGNLEHIGKGAVKVDYCPNLCYVKTINWQSLGASSLDYPLTEQATNCTDRLCPTDCDRYCWNNSVCQKRNTNFCEFFDNDGRCVHTCPKNKVTNYELMRCMTKEECVAIMNNSWWIFNNTCVQACPIFYYEDKTVEGGCRYMGNKYMKVCEGNKIVNMDGLEQMRGCTHINGSLEIVYIDDYSLEPYLEKYLGYIANISGFLKIANSKAIRSLDFLKNLVVIEGKHLENNAYSIFIYKNENLQRLWNFTDNFTLTVANGALAFHDNPVLCLSEIDKLKNLLGITNNDEREISKDTNGYKSVCNQKELSINITKNNPTNITLIWQRENPIDNEDIIGYTVYYINANNNNVTLFDNTAECDAESWNSIFVRENEIELKNLHPHTRYGYYIKTYKTSSQGEQTPINYVRTASTEPSEPLNFTAEATSDTSILLKWKSPLWLNGILTHYRIGIASENDYLPERDYCRNPYNIDLEKPKILKNDSITASKTNCTCLDDVFTQSVTEDLTCTEDGKQIHTCLKILEKGKQFYVNSFSEFDDHTIKERSSIDIQPDIFKVSANNTSYEFKNLSHYALYIFYLDACNVDPNDNRTHCGSTVMVSERTKKRKSADIVENLQIKTEKTDAIVTWYTPDESNSLLVAYQIEYKRTDSDSFKSRRQCIKEDIQLLNGRKYEKILELDPGKYAIHVRAISLAGPGNFSNWEYFQISSEDSSTYQILLPILFLIFVALAILFAFIWYRKRKSFYNTHLIPSINPDYAGPIYEEDDWEIDRKDIEIIKELGQGSFGMVYQGIIKSRRYPCAIKTVNESASMPSRMEFLNEGSVMKTFNDAHHVVRLLGIVSRGQPPLVIMELMERGDLKSYLRRCREPSQNLTTNELYRMAVEIADGMAYLAAKKFVHRDLAARNCMVAADRTVKIGDFGMARDIYETDYYRKETVGLLPVRWMAPESLADGVFTSDSDVWSYGIVLWEMATLAEQPYQGHSNEEVFHFVKNKGKLERPSECSDLLYEVMDACWMWRPNDRPTFSDIVNKLVDHVGEDFRLVAFCFSRQGLELALNAGPRVYNPPAMIATEDDFFGHYDPSEEEVNLCLRDSNRPTRFLPFSNQRTNQSSPYQLSPGSPSSTFSFNSS